MPLSSDDISAIVLSLKLASLTTVLLLLLGSPLAWWLSQSQNRFKKVIASVVALPLVLPPSVLGFYLLVAMGPNGPLGQLSQWLGIGLLPFTFTGLVIASIIYSLPFVVQPLYNAFSNLGKRPLEVAATLGANKVDCFISVVLPLCKSGFISAAILCFAHTLGEFGVILMIGGNIPGETRVLSVQIYDHVEMLSYEQAHWLSAGMLLFSFIVLMSLQALQRSDKQKESQS